jgi:hypothetical protein
MNYFMSAGYEIEDIHAEEFQRMIDDEAKYLVSDSRKLEARGDIQPPLLEVASCGRFNVFTLHCGFLK